MNVLHVLPDFPFPPDNGARADVWSRILAMKSLGYAIDVLVMAQKVQPAASDVAAVRRVVDNLHFVERRPLWKCIATRRPTYISRNGALSKHPLNRAYDVTIMEAEDTFPVTENPSLRTGLKVLRVHNDEITYLREFVALEESFTRRHILRLELMRLKAFVEAAHETVDQLWFISDNECRRFIATHPNATHKAAWLPPSIEIRNVPRRMDPGNKRVLFVGNLYTPFNRDGLRWYLQHVHPALLAEPDYEFVVAGSSKDVVAARIFAEEVGRQPRCTVHLDIADPSSLYESCAMFVNPMHAGAGVKLKTIHAIERCIPVVSTSIGNEGTGFGTEHITIADTPEHFISAVGVLLNNRCLRVAQADRAYDQLITRYDAAANIAELMNCMTACCAWTA